MSLSMAMCNCVVPPDSMCFAGPDQMYRCCGCNNRIQRSYNPQNVIQSTEIFTFTDGVSEPVRCTVCRGVMTYDVVIKEFYCQPTRNGCGKHTKAWEMLLEYERLDRLRCRVGGTAQKGQMSISPSSSSVTCASTPESPRHFPVPVVKCECGNDAADSGGIHSPWCPKAKGQR